MSKALIHVGAFPYKCQANNGTDGLSGISDVTTIVVKGNNLQLKIQPRTSRKERQKNFTSLLSDGFFRDKNCYQRQNNCT